jgi:hypothetical protein
VRLPTSAAYGEADEARARSACVLLTHCNHCAGAQQTPCIGCRPTSQPCVRCNFMPWDLRGAGMSARLPRPFPVLVLTEGQRQHNCGNCLEEDSSCGHPGANALSGRGEKDFRRCVRTLARCEVPSNRSAIERTCTTLDSACRSSKQRWYRALP